MCYWRYYRCESKKVQSASSFNSTQKPFCFQSLNYTDIDQEDAVNLGELFKNGTYEGAEMLRMFGFAHARLGHVGNGLDLGLPM